MQATQPRKDWPVIGSVALGAAVGLVAVKMMSKDDKKKINDWVNAQMKKIDDILSSDELKDRVSSIYDSVDTNTKSLFSKMYQAFLAKVYTLRDKAEDIDKSKYNKLVEDFAQQLKSDGDFNDKQLKRLKDYLTQDYKMLVEKS
jgi:hypothetical protein